MHSENKQALNKTFLRLAKSSIKFSSYGNDFVFPFTGKGNVIDTETVNFRYISLIF